MSDADVLVDPAEALRRQRRAGRADGLQPREVAAVAGLDLRLHARGDVARAGAEARDPRRLGEIPQHAHVRMPGRAVVEHDRAVGEQAADEEVPHHPAGRREPEEAVALLHVHVEVELLEVLEQDPALPLDDRLRQPGGARGVQDPQRVVERHALERQLAVAQEALLPALAVEVAELHELPADLGVDAGDDVRRGRSRGRCSGSRRPPAAPSARSARSGRSRCGRRSRASSSTTRRRSTRWRGTRRSPRGCSACRRRRGRRARPRAPAARRRSRAPARAARPT